jgi:hypothetical protein
MSGTLLEGDKAIPSTALGFDEAPDEQFLDSLVDFMPRSARAFFSAPKSGGLFFNAWKRGSSRKCVLNLVRPETHITGLRREAKTGSCALKLFNSLLIKPLTDDLRWKRVPVSSFVWAQPPHSSNFTPPGPTFPTFFPSKFHPVGAAILCFALAQQLYLVVNDIYGPFF